MPPRYAARIDDCQPGIVNGLKGRGCSVEHLARLGRGGPDILVGYGGVNLLFELKTPGSEHERRKPGLKSHGSQTALRQLEWYESWRGTVYRSNNLEEIWGLIQAAEARWTLGLRDA